MKEIINIKEKNGSKVCSARELYNYLEVKTDFTNWCKRMFEYGFIDGQDFTPILEKSTGGRPSTDYALTLDCAKEISMLQRTEKGKKARLYFIEAERKFRESKQLDFDNPDTVLQLAQNWKAERQRRERAEERIALQEAVIEEAAPKVNYFDEVLQSESTYVTNQIAKELGMSARTLNRKLREFGIQYNQNGTWVLYAKYQDKGYTRTKTHYYRDTFGETKTSMQTVWTEKGRKFIHDFFKHKSQIDKL